MPLQQLLTQAGKLFSKSLEFKNIEKVAKLFVVPFRLHDFLCVWVCVCVLGLCQNMTNQKDLSPVDSVWRPSPSANPGGGTGIVPLSICPTLWHSFTLSDTQSTHHTYIQWRKRAMEREQERESESFLWQSRNHHHQAWSYTTTQRLELGGREEWSGGGEKGEGRESFKSHWLIWMCKSDPL